MKFTYALMAAVLAAALPVRAVYAPIPDQEQGKDLTVTVRAGFTHDDNIFGAPAHTTIPDSTGKLVDVRPIQSAVWELAPRIVYNKSLTDQTFFSANYGLKLDEIQNRPGTKLLDSHDLMLRLAHSFSQATTLDLTDMVTLDRNPASLLTGVPVNSDQSSTHNQFDAHYTTSLTPKIGAEAKFRSAYTNYWNATLGRTLDRTENLYGLAGNYAILQELKAVAEYRHLDVNYRTNPDAKNKRSDYLMAGLDYEVAKKLTLTSRVGGEWRHRSVGAKASSPFAEFSARYDYGERSFLTAGYGYTIDETSDPTRFSDQNVNRLFASVQHAVTALIVASVSVDYEPAKLQGLPGIAVDINETTSRVGGALSYVPTKNWVFSITYDFDRVTSDDSARSTKRQRAGASVTYTF